MLTAVTRSPVRRLPVQPVVAAAVLDRLGAATTSAGAAELTSWIELDPALAAAVLHAANMPHLNHAGKVGSIRQAMVVLGSQMVEAIATGRVATLVMGAEDPGSPASFWPRSISAGVGARIVARLLGGSPDDAYTAGLLHDVGDLVLFRGDPTAHAEATTGATGRTLLDRERQAFGRTHTETGATILREWGLPDRLCAAVRSHHAPAEGLTGTLGRAVWAGTKLGYSVARVGPVEQWSPGAILKLVGSEERPERVVAEIERDIAAIVARVEGAR